MHYCTACNKAIATIHILDLNDGSIAEEKHLCPACADQAGLVQTQKIPLKLGSTEMLDFIGVKGDLETEPQRGASCPACGLTQAEFRVRGRLGCPRCYEVFRSTLLPVLERVHDATCHRGRSPARSEKPAPRENDVLADLRKRLSLAIDAENYEEAASLRDQIRGHEGKGTEAP